MDNRNNGDDSSNLTREIVRELQATTELVKEAAALGKNELLHYLNESMKGAQQRTEQYKSAYNINNGAARYTSAQTQRAQTQYNQTQAQRTAQTRRSAASARRTGADFSANRVNVTRKVSSGAKRLRSVAIPLLAIAGLLLFSFFMDGAWDGEVLTMAALFGIPGGAALYVSRDRTRRERRYERYVNALGSAPYMSVDKLSTIANVSKKRCLKDLQDLTERGYLGPGAYVDTARGLLVADAAAVEEAERQRREAESARRAQEAAAQEAQRSQAASAAPSHELPEEYDRMLRELRILNERIEGEEMSQRIYRIEAVAKATFLAVKEKPEKLPQLQRFMDYYLPTTIKLLDAYAGFEKQDVSGENIRRSKENIEKMMGTLSEAFEKQFDSLFLTETMDINAEIKTMDSLLKQDGLTGGMTFPGV